MTGTELAERRQFSFTTRPYLAVDDTSGEPIGLDDIDVRVGWLLDLITSAETELLTRLWHPDTFDLLAAGCDRDGRALSTHGHVVAARLGWTPTYPNDIYVPSGFARGVRRQLVARTRRSGEVTSDAATSDTAQPERLRITDIHPHRRPARGPASRPPTSNSPSSPSPPTRWC